MAETGGGTSTATDDDAESGRPSSSGAGAPTSSGGGTTASTQQLRLEEYKIASAEARYRDQMLFTSFYISLVALAVLLQVRLRLFDQQRLLAVASVALVAAIGFASLLWWSYATKRARNKAWGRRSELEQKPVLSRIQLNEFLAGDTSYDFETEELTETNGVIGRASRDIVIVFAAGATVVWLGVAAGSVTAFLAASMATPPAEVILASGVAMYVAVLGLIHLSGTLAS